MSLLPKPWKYGVREDGGIWFSMGDPMNGPHRQFDLGEDEEFAKLVVQLPDLLDRLKLAEKALEHIAHGGEKARYVAALNLSLIREGPVPAPAIDCKEQVQKLSAFVREGLEISWEGGDWCGADIQDKAEELGLIRKEPYDPEKHGEDFEGAPGDTYYVINQDLVPAINCKTE